MGLKILPTGFGFKVGQNAPFYSHRVNEILNSTNIEDWQYVSTKSNAANDATRYIPFRDLNSNSQWFNRPNFVYNDSVTKTNYVNCSLEGNSNANENLNKIDNEVLISTSVKPRINWSYYTSLAKIVRHLAWILKLKGNWIHWKRGEEGREDFT